MKRRLLILAAVTAVETVVLAAAAVYADWYINKVAGEVLHD